jgi:DNA polymerase
VQSAAIKSIRFKKDVILKDYKNLIFDSNGEVMTIKLPSGRKLFYQSPTLTVNKWGGDSVKYKGMDSVTRKWTWIPSYGGKFVENIVQAIARDLLADSMRTVDAQGYEIVMHVHDEMVVEIPEYEAKYDLRTLENIMGAPNPWAEGLPLNADGYLTPFYKKD